MSVSDIARQALVEYFSHQGIETKASQWKRRTKSRVAEDYVNRIFEHNALGAVLTISYDDDAHDTFDICIWEPGEIGFKIDQKSQYLSFTPMARWLRGTKDFPNLDDHIERGIAAIPQRWCGDDAGDNLFWVEDIEAVRSDLLARGLIDLSNEA